MKNRFRWPPVIAVVGTRGGIGSTTVAFGLGTRAKKLTVLIDLDLALGNASGGFGYSPEYTLADLVFNFDRLNIKFLRKCLAKRSENLYLLPHPIQLEDIELVRPKHIEAIVNILRNYQFQVILDLSKRFTPIDLTAIRLADIILLVMDESSLYNAVRIMTSLEGRNAKPVLINGDVKKAEEYVGSVFWYGDIEGLAEAL